MVMAPRNLPPIGKIPGILDLVYFSAWHRVRIPVAIATLWATFVYALAKLGVPWNVGGSAGSLVSILSMVTGLMVSFRSGSSYDRWYEGRRTFASLQSTSRSMLRHLVLALPPTTTLESPQGIALEELCALVCAFSFASMEHLRDNPGVNSNPQLRALLPTELIEAYESTPQSARRGVMLDGPENVHHSSASEADRAIAGLNVKPSVLRSYPTALSSGAPTNLPLSLIRTMQAYLNALHRDIPGYKLDDSTFGTCSGNLTSFTDTLTALERIRDTPIPLILNIHLQLLLFFYIAAVPLQLVRTMHIWVIPATAIAAVVFYGVDRAGEELSDPFGTEPNDLPLGKFCSDIHREYLELSGRGGSAGNTFLPSQTLGSEKSKKSE